MMDLKGFLLAHLRLPGMTRPEAYLAEGGWETLRLAVSNRGPDAILRDVEASGLRGRGRGAFSAAVKWKLVARSEAPRKVVVMNGAECGPGGFKDRFILESSPYLVLEALLLAAFAVGADHAVILVRREFGEAVAGLRRALEWFTTTWLPGQRGLEALRKIEVEIIGGGGIYCCGEETALLETLEGKRGIPRSKPPFPTSQGLWQRPTLVSNVETLINVPFILARGAEWFRSFGLANSPGTRLFAVSGQIRQPGIYEFPVGTPLSSLIEEAGGARPGEKILAVIPGGAGSGLLPAGRFDTLLAEDALAAAGSTLGSGTVIVLAESCCIVEVAANIARFFEQESCGKCTPCREGNKRLVEILSVICHPKRKSTSGRGSRFREVLPPSPRELVENLSETMNLASACGLGRSSPEFLRSALKWFPEEFEAHFVRQECSRKVCFTKSGGST